MSKFYPQILSTAASFYIYDRPLTDINVIASVYEVGIEFADKIFTFAVLERWLLQLRESDSTFCFILECGPMPNVMAALPNIGGARCSTPQSLDAKPAEISSGAPNNRADLSR